MKDSLMGKSPPGPRGLIPGTRNPAFTISLLDDLSIPIVIASPHAGRSYPERLLSQMRDPEFSRVRLEDRYVDHVAARAARISGAGLLVAHAPRAMIDLNRARDDVDWTMIEGGEPDSAYRTGNNNRALSGLGLVPRRLAGLGEIWRSPLPAEALEQRITYIHEPYHAALAHVLEHIRDRWGIALLLDLHSMPPLKKVHPDDCPAHFVLGDRFGSSADDRLVGAALQCLGAEGATITHNRPYAGGYVLARHAKPERQIHALQIEICRSLYLDRQMSMPTARIVSVSEVIGRLVRSLGNQLAMIRRDSEPPLAAE